MASAEKQKKQIPEICTPSQWQKQFQSRFKEVALPKTGEVESL
jgi:hypothetical protein